MRGPLFMELTNNPNKKRKLTMAATPKSNDFAFIVNRHPFPNPYLVHISRMSKTRTETLDYFKPNVIYTPRSMDFILKPLLHHEELFNFHCQFKGYNTN
jgi:hypothetical protein